MYDFNQQFNSKIQQFADIDKEIEQSPEDFFSDSQYLEEQPLGESHNLKTKLKLNVEQELQPSGPHYDVIYSHFPESFSRNSKAFSKNPTASPEVLASTKYETKTKVTKINTTSNNTNQGKQVTKMNKSSSMTMSPLKKSNNSNFSNSNMNISNNNVGTRLYNYGFYIRNKIESQKQREEQNFNNRSKPKINQGTMVDWENPSIGLSKPFDNNQRKRSTSKDYDDNYTHHPNLDRNSLHIAEGLEPSFERLVKKRKRFTSQNNIITSNTRSSVELSYDWRNQNDTYTNRSRTKSSTNRTPKRIQTLYSNGVNKIKDREYKYKANIQQKDEEFKYYPYKPKITAHPSESTITRGNQRTNGSTSAERYQRHMNWKNRVERKNQTQRDKMSKDESRGCTFRPQIVPLAVNNDEEFIKRNLNQMNDYVIRRRAVLQKQKDNEVYKKKRLGNNANHFVMKTTHPKEFNFHQKKTPKLKTCCSSQTNSSLMSRKSSNASMTIPIGMNMMNTSTKTETAPLTHWINYSQNQFNINVNLNSGNTYNNNGYMINNNNNNLIDEGNFIAAINDLHSRLENINL